MRFAARNMVRHSYPAILVCALLIGAATLVGSCSNTTEAVDQTFVTITASSPVVLRGDQLELTGSVWIRTAPGDSVVVPNAELMWTTDDPTLATLSPKDNRTTIATGVNSGTVAIHAVATGFQGAAQAVYPLRVSDPVEIDSIRPATIRYGEKLTMYGVGVNTLLLAGLQGAALIPDTFSVALGAGGLGQLSFWVPPPARSGHAVSLSPTQVVVASDSTTVLRKDLYEPNDSTPSQIDISGTPFPAIPAVRFYNPALAFEDRVRADSLGVDWYRLTGASVGSDLTFIFQAPTFKNAHLTFLASPVNSADSVSQPGWTIGSGLYSCKDHAIKVEEQPADSLIIALKNVPAGNMDLISLFFVTGRYGLAVVQGYLTSDPSIGADQLEENDNCEFADRNFTASPLDLSTPFSASLTIDNPHDVDWIRFRVPGLLAQPVTFRTAPVGLVDPNRPTDVDLYVIGIPVAGSPLDRRSPAPAEGSNETMTLVLQPGDYYMLVTDFAGTPTRYGICAAIGATCSLPPSAMITQAPAHPRAALRRGGIK